MNTGWKREYALLLLAGGRSSRMGEDKAVLLYRNKTFMENLFDKADALGIREKYLSGHSFTGDRVISIEDVYRDRGPLGGLHACMKCMKTPYCLVVPVDVPQIPQKILQELLEKHRQLVEEGHTDRPLLLCHGDRTEPLIGIYPTSMTGMIEEEIREHPAPVFSVLKKSGYFCFRGELLPWQAGNINTKEAYEALLHAEESKGW